MQQNYVNHTSTYDSSVLASDNLNQSVNDIYNYRTGDEHTTLPQTIPSICTSNNNQTDLRFTKRGLHIANLNIRHLKPKLDNIKMMLCSSHSVDILGTCETFLNSSVPDDILHVPGYIFERKDRAESGNSTSTNGGGILIYLSNHINYVRRHDLECSNIESIWVEIKIRNSKSFLLCSVYRPPSSPTEWYDYFSTQIDKSHAITEEIYIMGDLNVNVERQNATLTCIKWKHITELYDLHQLIQEPTRITAHSSTLIDHLYVSTPENVTESFVPKIAVSDHYPICFTRSTAKRQLKRHDHKSINYRCFRKFNENDFCNDLSIALNTLHTSNSDTNQNFDNWCTIFSEALEKHAPVKSKRIKHEIQPEWLNDDIKSAAKKRDTYHKHKNWHQYKIWRNRTNSLIRKAKSELFAKSIAENKNNSFLWKHVKSLKGQHAGGSIPTSINIGNTHSENMSDVLNEMNKYFTSISDKLREESGDDTFPYDFSKLNAYVESKIPQHVKFTIPVMKIDDLLSIINSLDPNKATGLDGISARILKSSAHVICPSLLEIINLSITTGVFPDSLKIAKVNPIHKSGPKDDPANYRPISILSVLSKIIEKHITKHLFAYMNKYNILHKSQSGFRKKYSCNTA